jgi:rod shape-determining protein MreD
MTLMIKLVVLISFFLDGLLSVYQGSFFFDVFFFMPLFTIVSLTIVYPYYQKYRFKYYRLCLITGLVYDLLYTNTLFLNMFVLLFLGFIISRLYGYFTNDFMNDLAINVIVLMTYRILTYIILSLIGYLPFGLGLITHNLISIIIVNTLFLIIVNLIMTVRFDKKGKKPRYS